MRENSIQKKSFDFSVRIIKLFKYLQRDKKEKVLSGQILRSGTSIGANIEEALGGVSKSDFINKLSISYKEAGETFYWLKLLHTTQFIKLNEFNSLSSDCSEICKLLFKIIQKSKANRVKPPN